jgi:4-amino-4-deoxy-L-arabinose transferase-like glycosyltransferase
MLADLPQMAGFALAVAGFAASARGRRVAGMLIGAGAGVGFLGKGLFAPAVIGVCALTLPLVFAQWRTRRYFVDLAWAGVASLPFLVVWPAALWMRSPALFMEWLWDNNIGRYLGFSVPYLGAASESGFWLETWPWFLFPLWIFAARALARERRRLLDCAGAQVGLTMAACIAIVLATSASARAIYALSMIPPLALVAARPGGDKDALFDSILYIAGIAFAFAVATIVWTGWASLAFYGRAPDWPWLTNYFPSVFALEIDRDDVAVAVAMTVGFALACAAVRRSTHRGVAAWVGGVGLSWALVALLWFPWIDNAKSYRGLYDSLARAVPAGVNCVASLDLGESERAVLEYVLGLRTIDMHAGCNAVLRQTRADKETPRLPLPWRRAWFGSRPGDFRERFELWVR